MLRTNKAKLHADNKCAPLPHDLIVGGSGSAKEGAGVVKGGVGTQSKNCIHECAFPPSFSEADVEAAVAKLRYSYRSCTRIA